jgi:hypothetical protein
VALRSIQGTHAASVDVSGAYGARGRAGGSGDGDGLAFLQIESAWVSMSL